MARTGGFKIADAYVEIHADRDALNRQLEEIPRQSGPAADRAGRDLGQKLTEGLTRAVEASSAKIARARQEEQRATDAVKLAELRLSEARDSGKAKASTLLALEQRLTQEQLRLASAHSQVERATIRHADAERRLGDALRDIGKNAGPNAERAGDDAGGKLAKGMQLAIIRNSPLIVAAVGAVLAAGAPVLLTAATALFGVIGIVAAAQSARVKAAWSDTWQQIRAGSEVAARPIEDVLVGLADKVEARFAMLQPRLRGAFADLAPQLDTISTAALNAAENALPGLFRAIDRGRPVTEGFGTFLEKIGTGVSDFFDAISTHSGAAGQVWSDLGTTMGTLLPILGELLGQGAELAKDVLPLVNSTLGTTLSVVRLLGPALPIVAKGLGAFAIARSVSGWLTSAGGAVDTFRVKTGLAETGSTKFATAAGKVGSTLPLIGLAVVGLTEAFTAASRETDQAAQQFEAMFTAMRQGGAAGEQARASIELVRAKIDELKATGGSATAINFLSDALHRAEAASHAAWVAMTPMEQAQSKMTEWAGRLAIALRDQGAGSDEAQAAQRRYAYWSGQLDSAQGQLETALHGVTQAMLDQADQALAAIDSSFAYRHATNQLEDAQKTLADAIKTHGRNSEEASRAQLDLEEATFRAAQAFGQEQADMSGAAKGSAEYARIVQTQTLAELYRLRDAAGPQMRAAIQQQIDALTRAGVTLDNTGAKAAGATGQMQNLGRQRPTPQANLITSLLTGNWSAAMSRLGTLNAQRPTPVASVRDLASGTLAGILNRINLLHDKTVNVTTNYYSNYANANMASAPYRAAGGRIGLAVGGSPGGRVSGPGTGTSDSVGPFATRTGVAYLSDDEWVVKARSALGYGDRKMRAVNEGRAIILTPEELRGFAAGGPPGGVQVTPTADGAVLSIGELHVHIQGIFDFTKPAETRRLALQLHEMLARLEKEHR